METVQATIRFMGYKVQSLRYRKKEGIVDSDVKIELHPSFSRHIFKISENQYDLELSIVMDQPDLPFDAEVTIVGSFQLSNSLNTDKAMKQNATAILYPYVRSTLAMLTTLAAIPPINIPTINLARMFEQEQQKEEALN